MFSTFISAPISAPNWRSQPGKHRTHRPMPQWVSFFECLSPSLSGKLLVWSQCNTLSCSASAACLQCADFDCCSSNQTCKNQVTTFPQSPQILTKLQSQGLLATLATSQSWYFMWKNSVKLPNYHTSCEISSSINSPKIKKEKSPKCQVETDFQPLHIFLHILDILILWRWSPNVLHHRRVSRLEALRRVFGEAAEVHQFGQVSAT